MAGANGFGLEIFWNAASVFSSVASIGFPNPVFTSSNGLVIPTGTVTSPALPEYGSVAPAVPPVSPTVASAAAPAPLFLQCGQLSNLSIS